MKIYLLPGMGADQRLFSRLDPGGHELSPVRWLTPSPQDSLEDYARKLLPQITDPGRSLILGVSMGGMLAVELGKLLSFRKIILVSSAKTFHEIPPYLRRAGKAGWHKRIRTENLVRLRRLAAPLMNQLGEGYRASWEMIKDTDPAFLNWCVDAVLKWKNETVPPNVIHIHGTRDLLLPARYVSGFIPVRRGSHLMIYEKAKEISRLLRDIYISDEIT